MLQCRIKIATMTITRRAVTIGGILSLMPSSSVFAQTSTPLTDKELDAPFVRRRAVDAAVWAIPILNFDAMRQAYFRDGGAKYNDIIWWPKASTWKTSH